MKLLWISPRWPFPADDGAKQATASLTLALAERGHEVVVVTFARERELAPSPHPRIRLLAHFPADPLGSRALRALRNLASPLPVSAEPFSGFGLNWERFASEMPHAVVIDGNHGFAAFLGKPCPWPLFYRAHNNETSLWEQAATTSSPGFYFRMQARRMRKFEAALGEASRAIAAISPSDADDFRAWFPNTKVGWVPMGFRFAPPPLPPPGPLTLGYVGRMDWPPNREGLEWFLSKIWPEVRRVRPEVRLKVAGSGDAGWLEEYDGFDRLGKIPDVTELYSQVHAVIAPVHFGSGTKIKVVEAVSHGRAVFATLGAQQGSALSADNFALLSDSASEWVSALADADREALSRLGAGAFSEARGIFGIEQAADKFISLLSLPGV